MWWFGGCVAGGGFVGASERRAGGVVGG